MLSNTTLSSAEGFAMLELMKYTKYIRKRKTLYHELVKHISTRQIKKECVVKLSYDPLKIIENAGRTVRWLDSYLNMGFVQFCIFIQLFGRQGLPHLRHLTG